MFSKGKYDISKYKCLESTGERMFPETQSVKLLGYSSWLRRGLGTKE